MMTFSVYINNSFGKQAEQQFTEYTNAILNVAQEVADSNISFDSNLFRKIVTEQSFLMLIEHFPDIRFEFIYLKKEEHIYLIVNNIHSRIRSPYEQFLYDNYSSLRTLH